MSVGTPLYMPPESIEECVYSHKSDFFALGCIFYELLHGKTPWYRKDEKALANIMKKHEINLN
jgi:serine/threonine protein kinase